MPCPTRRPFLWPALALALTLALPAAAQQTPGSTYAVGAADTLWELALRFRAGTGVNAQQAMIAILRANPEAFQEGNINALRRGVTLRVPSAADMAAVTPAEAAAEFARHEEAWRNRGRTGTAAPGPAPVAQPAAAPPVPTAARSDAGSDQPGPSAELVEARAVIDRLRRQLSERDAEIESLLVRLFTAKEELERVRGVGVETPEAPASGSDRDAPAEFSRPSLPVSPLILGSALVVILILVVVVTLIRRREGPESAGREEGPQAEGWDEEPLGDEPDEERRAAEIGGEPSGEDEDPLRETDDGSSGEGEDGLPGDRGEAGDAEEPPQRRGEDGHPEVETDELRIGLDLEEDARR